MTTGYFCDNPACQAHVITNLPTLKVLVGWTTERYVTKHMFISERGTHLHFCNVCKEAVELVTQ